ncbi:S8 family serine peptidase [Kutzneria sp. CA-103260]|uniref:S8 family serine peptidase n=1 Tax=Kutzneria sp. CA-103260 TaxID=2802641 RepID=UPI001BA484BA|nr:S8 family serine peptidase [Kutzneria sp. CA-103260]QUQ62899.1 Subtilase family protein [Kutzneria sp. CA-103260]
MRIIAGCAAALLIVSGPIVGSPQAIAAADVGPDSPVVVELAGGGGVHADASIPALAGAQDVRRLGVVNGYSATVSPQQLARLRADSRVAKVVPDALIWIPRQDKAATAAGGQALPGACAPNGGVQLNPEAVGVIHAVSDDPAAKTARSLGATGAGVTVGDIAGSIDVNTPELVRPDGSHVITSYQDFTGEGGSVVSEDIESFLDDGMIAAQGNGVYDLAGYTARHLPTPCRIRVEGVAPRVNLTAYKVYGSNDYTTTSAFLQAIDYAVYTDHVNVLNEEAGSFPMPDTSADLIKTANANAMAAGVTITVPSYDSGLNSTIWSPASQPGVISVGASTTYRSYAQVNEAGLADVGGTGWVSDNISSLSSGGFTEQGRGIDIVAPGDLDWAICTADPKAAPDCVDYNGKPSGVYLSGGTSEAGPLVAGVAALVIQAYRETHGGVTPSPALVSHLITGTADDLGIAAFEQGAGRVDAYRAVQAARSVGDNVIADTDQLDAVGTAGSDQQFTVNLTNTGATAKTVDLAGRTQGTSRAVRDADVQLSASDPTYVSARGATRGYVKVPFDVPAGSDRLDAEFANPGADKTTVDMLLLDPKGRVAGYSLPEGIGNHGHSDVGSPVAGHWTAVIAATRSANGYQGVVHFEARVASNRPFGTVTPSKVVLPPGKSAKVKVNVKLPTEAGDVSAALTYTGGSLPISLRTLVPIRGGVGTFAADMTGGNGRTGTPAQTFFYNVDVPAGKPALDVSTVLADKDPYYTYLISPDGQTAAQGSNQLPVGQGATVSGNGTRLHAVNPAAGRWTVIITFTNPVLGNAIHTPLTGRVTFDPVAPKVSGLPTGGVVKAGSTQVVAVTVHNDSPAVGSYFLDARLAQSVSMTLKPLTPTDSIVVPMPQTENTPLWNVPTNTSSVSLLAQGTAPVMFDAGPYNGEPDIGSTAFGNSAVASFSADNVTPGLWYATLSAVGPGPIQPFTASMAMNVTTRAFDSDAQSPSGSLWGNDFHPVIVQPGQTTTLYLTIHPTGPVGSIVDGTLFLDDSSALTQYGNSPSADQLAALHYHYTVG